MFLRPYKYIKYLINTYIIKIRLKVILFIIIILKLYINIKG